MQKILIADDEPKVGRLVRELIHWDKLGLELAGICQDGQKALDLIHSEKPNIVITDIRMPTVSGLDLIRLISEEKLPVHFIVISGYRYFEYAHTALKYGVEDYLLKPIEEDELNGVLERICAEEHNKQQERAYVAQIEQKFTSSRYVLHREWIENILKDGELASVKNMGSEYGLDFQEGNYLALSIKADRQLDISRSLEQEKMLQEKMVHVIEKNFRSLVYELAIAPRKALCILVLFNYAPERQSAVQQQVYPFLTCLKDCANNFAGYTVTLGISFEGQNLGQAPQLFYAAQLALDSRIRKGTGICLKANDDANLSQTQRKVDALIKYGGREVQNAAETLQPEPLKAGIEGCFEEAERQDVLGCVYYALAGQLIKMFLSGVNDKKDELLLSECDECGERIGNCTSIHRLKEELITGLTGTLLRRKTRQQDRERRPIQEAVAYIRGNYSKKISLEDAAAVSGFNPNYFSDLFKRETGCNFTDYLVEVRINAAKEMLRDSPMTVYKIADAVGYRDSKFFSQQFTKIVGIKPTEYRRIYS
jgi:Response regulator containing CheY-like receiver domain and AraC-type DNA-binding domain